MNRIEKLKNKVDNLYQSKNPDRADWADWLYQNHISVVAKNAEQLSKRFGVKNDLAIAASVLHDIADAVTKREDPKHEEKSKEIAKKFLKERDFTEDEIKIVVNDAIEFHGCKNGNKPKTIEGKIMATADALAHLKTNFYDHFLESLKKTDSFDEIAEWALPKIERDYKNKIFFEDVRKEAEKDYNRVKALFKT